MHEHKGLLSSSLVSLFLLETNPVYDAHVKDTIDKHTTDWKKNVIQIKNEYKKAHTFISCVCKDTFKR